ncbi:MAG: hypothetical protein K2X27_23200 [Candidatus Obscuribacterales bacterium]|nr:hypothetical protein [Candidatus Obscuribacterales bacterium]
MISVKGLSEAAPEDPDGAELAEEEEEEEEEEDDDDDDAAADPESDSSASPAGPLKHNPNAVPLSTIVFRPLRALAGLRDKPIATPRDY